MLVEWRLMASSIVVRLKEWDRGLDDLIDWWRLLYPLKMLFSFLDVDGWTSNNNIPDKVVLWGKKKMLKGHKKSHAPVQKMKAKQKEPATVRCSSFPSLWSQPVIGTYALFLPAYDDYDDYSFSKELYYVTLYTHTDDWSWWGNGRSWCWIAKQINILFHVSPWKKWRENKSKNSAFCFAQAVASLLPKRRPFKTFRSSEWYRPILTCHSHKWQPPRSDFSVSSRRLSVYRVYINISFYVGGLSRIHFEEKMVLSGLFFFPLLVYIFICTSDTYKVIVGGGGASSSCGSTVYLDLQLDNLPPLFWSLFWLERVCSFFPFSKKMNISI